MTTVTLYCTNGAHHWERQSQRGKRPRNCPLHKEAITNGYDPTEEPSEIDEAFLASCREEVATRGNPLGTPSGAVSKPHTRSQARISADTARHRGITAILNDRHNCTCDIHPDSTDRQLRQLGEGCTAPQWVCPVLDKVRRLYVTPL